MSLFFCMLIVKLVKDIDRVPFNFLSKNKTHDIRKNVLLDYYKHGGL